MINFQNLPKLDQGFYLKDAVEVAKNLLGKIIVRQYNNKLLAGTIVEVEAYDESEEASHSFNGLSRRNEVMFQKGGLLYVYLIYGIHYCCNVVTGNAGHGAAVLIRAVEPLNNLNLLAKNRFNKTSYSEKEKLNLTNGPAKLCKAFHINLADNGEKLDGNNIYLLDAPRLKDENIVQTTRIGITQAKELLWRFYIKGNRFVSKP
ncbi:MAG: DNA-3-methyladenine glycosylase [Bacteroidota bacterium]